MDPGGVLHSADEIPTAPSMALTTGGDGVPLVDLTSLRVISYVPNDKARTWIEEEVSGLACALHFGATLASTFQALREEIVRRVLIIDLDSLTSAELVELRILRKQTAGGTFIALGRVRQQLRASLRITHVVARPFGSEALRFIIGELERRRDTAELRRR